MANDTKDLIYEIGNIKFSYTDGINIKNIDGLPYFYYNDSSFFDAAMKYFQQGSC